MRMRSVFLVTLMFIGCVTSSVRAADMCEVLSEFLDKLERAGIEAKGNHPEFNVNAARLGERYDGLGLSSLHPLFETYIEEFCTYAYGCGTDNPFGIIGPSHEQCCAGLKTLRKKMLSECSDFSNNGMHCQPGTATGSKPVYEMFVGSVGFANEEILQAYVKLLSEDEAAAKKFCREAVDEGQMIVLKKGVRLYPCDKESEIPNLACMRVKGDYVPWLVVMEHVKVCR